MLLFQCYEGDTRSFSFSSFFVSFFSFSISFTFQICRLFAEYQHEQNIEKKTQRYAKEKKQQTGNKKNWEHEWRDKANYKYFFIIVIIIGIQCAMHHMLSKSFVFI